MLKMSKALLWTPPDEAMTIRVVDAHAGGEPLRVVVDGFPDLEGNSVLARRRFLQKHFDHLRRGLMHEPRGHADMYGCLMLPPVTEDAHFSVLFMHNAGYSTMCGHGIIAAVTVAMETGMLRRSDCGDTVEIDTPAGRVSASATFDGDRVRSVSFRNVPAWVEVLDAEVSVPGLGRVRFDLAFGGAYYAFVDAASVGLACRPESAADLIRAGRAAKRTIAAAYPVHHPVEEDLSFLYGTIFTGPSGDEGAHSRNVCIFADGELDRSPTGTGVSARAAIHFARGEIRRGEALTIESIVGSRFSVRVVDETRFGPHNAIVPEVTGSAFITGINTLILDPADPFQHGFFLR
jgi:trans-L-3-hydroxyproline dehydratase